MNDAKLYDWAARAAAEVVNLHLDHLDPSMRFNAVLAVFLKTVTLAAMEQREALLTPSRN